mmetsp:Transcript_147335/g.473417  ORF Transcript_147335/g.473417 Transcript_147335/m.473417 type:complete len:117 (-) Transcript_147335:24-374(-)
MFDDTATRSEAFSWVRTAMGLDDADRAAERENELSCTCYMGTRPGTMPRHDWKRNASVTATEHLQDQLQNALGSVPFIALQSVDCASKRVEYSGGLQLGPRSFKKWEECRAMTLTR